jgi:hypothetical protein
MCAAMSKLSEPEQSAPETEPPVDCSAVRTVGGATHLNPPWNGVSSGRKP